jgi:hypothetical protein
MSRTIELSDDLYRVLERYAEERQQTPEEALASWLRSVQNDASAPSTVAPVPSREPSTAEGQYPDPWEGFRGKFEAKYPDLIERHDYYIGQAALDTHADEDADE